MPPIPQRIGRYDILEYVGQGGMGVLYRGHDGVLERDVAVKVMSLDFRKNPTGRERFQREARAIARLQHSNVVTIHELGESDGTPYIVMEFLSGQDLDDVMRSNRTLTLGEKLDIVIQLCDGLSYAHERGIVHRDIKPGNVRLLEDGTIKILDFGIAKFAMTSITQSGAIMGTAFYMAPEQILGQAIDGRADLFSTGVLLHELLVGQKPFSGDSPTAVGYQIVHVEPSPVRASMPELPEALNDIVAKALRKDPSERYDSASSLSAALRTVRARLNESRPSVHAPAATALAASLARIRRAPMLAGIGVIAAIVVLASVFAFRAPPTAVSPEAAAPSSASAPEPSSIAAATAAPTVTVSSVPPGARIVLDGADTGRVTPASVTLDGKSPGKLELTLKGYRAVSATLTQEDLRVGRKELRLAREAVPVNLTISAPFAFELLQGTKVISPAAARHEVTVQPGGAPLSVRNVDLVLNAPVPVDFQRPQAEVILPAPGVLAVFAAVETCLIIVDGEDLGFPPIPRKSIASGSHTVVLRCPDGKETSRRVTVAAGERSAVTFSR